MLPPNGQGFITRSSEQAAAPPSPKDASPGKAAPAEAVEYRTVCVSETLPAGMQRQNWTFQDFEVHKQLYRGKLSIVYVALDKVSGKQVVLKLYRKRKLTVLNWSQVEREIRIHIKLDHESIIKLYAVFEDEKLVYMVQELAQGGDLFDGLNQYGGSLREKDAVTGVLAPVLKALSYLHGISVLHRDIKPENILLSTASVGKDGIKLADFGMAINANQERPVTRVGTLDYMAPEVLICPDKTQPGDNKDNPLIGYTAQVDSWAMGILAFELLVGSPPFESESRSTTYDSIMYKDPVLPASMSADAKSFIKQALSKSACNRPSIADLLRHPWITTYVAAEPALGSATPDKMPGRRASNNALQMQGGSSTVPHSINASPQVSISCMSDPGSPETVVTSTHDTATSAAAAAGTTSRLQGVCSAPKPGQQQQASSPPLGGNSGGSGGGSGATRHSPQPIKMGASASSGSIGGAGRGRPSMLGRQPLVAPESSDATSTANSLREPSPSKIRQTANGAMASAPGGGNLQSPSTAASSPAGYEGGASTPAPPLAFPARASAAGGGAAAAAATPRSTARGAAQPWYIASNGRTSNTGGSISGTVGAPRSSAAGEELADAAAAPPRVSGSGLGVVFHSRRVSATGQSPRVSATGSPQQPAPVPTLAQSPRVFSRSLRVEIPPGSSPAGAVGGSSSLQQAAHGAGAYTPDTPSTVTHSPLSRNSSRGLGSLFNLPPEHPDEQQRTSSPPTDPAAGRQAPGTPPGAGARSSAPSGGGALGVPPPPSPRSSAAVTLQHGVLSASSGAELRPRTYSMPGNGGGAQPGQQPFRCPVPFPDTPPDSRYASPVRASPNGGSGGAAGAMNSPNAMRSLQAAQDALQAARELHMMHSRTRSTPGTSPVPGPQMGSHTAAGATASPGGRSISPWTCPGSPSSSRLGVVPGSPGSRSSSRLGYPEPPHGGGASRLGEPAANTPPVRSFPKLSQSSPGLPRVGSKLNECRTPVQMLRDECQGLVERQDSLTLDFTPPAGVKAQPPPTSGRVKSGRRGAGDGGNRVAALHHEEQVVGRHSDGLLTQMVDAAGERKRSFSGRREPGERKIAQGAVVTKIEQYIRASHADAVHAAP